jgi:hypothetical protein
METTWNSHEVAAMLDMPYRTLMNWCEWGHLRPEGEGIQSYPYTWRAKDVHEAHVLHAMRVARVSMQKLVKVMDWLRSIGHNPLSTGEFVIVNGKADKPQDIIKFCTTGEAISLLQKGTRGQLILPLWTPEAGDQVIGK